MSKVYVRPYIRKTPFSKSTDMPYYDSMMKNPEYFKRNKGVTYKIKYMSPDEYLDKCYEIHCQRYIEMGKTPPTKERYMRFAIEESLAKKYADLMKKGEKFPIPVLDYNIMNQEGRHRAYAAKLLGVKEIPVLVVKKC